MPGTLALMTVGTQEIQSADLPAPVAEQLGPEARVKARPLAEQLETFDDDLLREALSDEVIRNGPCFRELDGDGPWTLAMLATDQPLDLVHRVGDTIGLARVLQRWIGLTRPAVRVLEPGVIARNPAQVDEALAADIEQWVRRAFEEARPDRVLVLGVGGTPAMRLLTERAAGLLPGPSETHTLLPSPDGEGLITEPVLGLLRRDETKRTLSGAYRNALRGGRHASAAEIARSMGELGITSANRLADLSDRAERLVDEGDWPQRLAARIAVTRRAEEDGRVGDALVHAVAAAELLPVAWLRVAHEVTDVRSGVIGRDRQCRRSADRHGPRPAHLQGAPGEQPSSEVDAARGLAACSVLRCEVCPLADAAVDEPAGRAWQDRAGALRATWLRNPPRTAGAPRELVHLRHAWAHPDRPSPGPSWQERADEAVAAEARKLAHAGIDAPDRVTGLAHLLRVVHRGVVGELPDDPLRAVEEEAEAILGHARLPGR